MISSLRSRIALGTTVATAVVVLIASVSVWIAGHTLLWRTVDAKLVDHARIYQQTGIPVPLHAATGRDATPGENPTSSYMTEVLRQDGSELHRSMTLTNRLELRAVLDADVPAGTIVSIHLADGRLVRGFWIHCLARVYARTPELAAGAAGAAGAGTITTADLGKGADSDTARLPSDLEVTAIQVYDMSAFSAELDRLAWLLAAVWISAVALSAVASAWLCRAVLRPVHRLSQAIQAVDPASMGSPMQSAPVPPEMQVLIERLNELFRRVESAMQREKATIANIAHELRTPIAGLRTTLEFAQARQTDAGARQVQDRCLKMVLQMQAMVGNLLTMARLEAGQESLRREEVDLIPLLEDCWEQHETLAESHRCVIEWAVPEHALASSAREQLRSVLDNLIDNAVSYTPAGGTIRISCLVAPERVELVVLNDTDGSLIDTSRVFEPFWRGDHARSSGTHCGLGLALVQRLARCLGAEVQATLVGSPARFELRLRLPAAPVRAPATVSAA